MAEKEYIERNALIAEYDRVHIGPPGGARKLMVEAPPADVAEVKHGEWISASPCGYYDFYCSCCKEFAITYEDSNYRERYHLTDYCPFCGAKMDGGKAE